ncbi:TPA: hypothetical protein PWS53_002863, partial [Enterococcus faecium]|nr:hypothetical protein [Enterococcus faecium]
MKKILVLANTYYQIIVAIQMKNTIFSDEYVEIIISDHSKNTKEIAKKIEEKKVFDGCHYLESKSFDDNIGYF